MAEKVASGTGGRERQPREVPQDLSGAVQEFRAHTAGLTNRLPLASLEAMRSGAVASPHTLARRYLLSAKRLGLPKVWAQQLVVWVQRQVNVIWCDDPTPLEVARRKALAAEAEGNAAELQALTAPCRAALEAERDTLAKEIANDEALLAKLDEGLAQP